MHGSTQRTGRALALAASVALLLFVSPSAAAKEGRLWHCWYSNDGSWTLSCFRTYQDVEKMDALATEDDMAYLAGELARARRFETLTALIRRSPGLLPGKLVRIPMHAHPREMDFAEELAQSVMCGNRQDCRVAFDRDTKPDFRIARGPEQGRRRWQ